MAGRLPEGKVLELGSLLKHDAALIPITYALEEGRRIYERSLHFVFRWRQALLFPRPGCALSIPWARACRELEGAPHAIGRAVH